VKVKPQKKEGLAKAKLLRRVEGAAKKNAAILHLRSSSKEDLRPALILQADGKGKHEELWVGVDRSLESKNNKEGEKRYFTFPKRSNIWVPSAREGSAANSH